MGYTRGCVRIVNFEDIEIKLHQHILPCLTAKLQNRGTVLVSHIHFSDCLDMNLLWIYAGRIEISDVQVESCKIRSNDLHFKLPFGLKDGISFLKFAGLS